MKLEEQTDGDGKDKAAQSMGKRSGKARAARLTAEQRREIAKVAAKARWDKQIRLLDIFSSIPLAKLTSLFSLDYTAYSVDISRPGTICCPGLMFIYIAILYV